MSEPWNVGANFWRGERALGGRLTVNHESLTFTPHAFDRATGGSDSFTAPLQEIARVAVVARSVTFPRQRFLIVTDDGRTGLFLTRRNREVTTRIRAAVAEAGGRGDREEYVPQLPKPEPDDSRLMNLFYSGWPQVFALLFFIRLLWQVIDQSANALWIALVASLVATTAYSAIRGFRRSARIRAIRKQHNAVAIEHDA